MKPFSPPTICKNSFEISFACRWARKTPSAVQTNSLTFWNAHLPAKAPLPFMGQKRRWNDAFKTALCNEFGDCTTFVDLFGGSGLLSHFTHTIRPDAASFTTISTTTPGVSQLFPPPTPSLPNCAPFSAATRATNAYWTR